MASELESVRVTNVKLRGVRRIRIERIHYDLD